jgi:hypothetical protein
MAIRVETFLAIGLGFVFVLLQAVTRKYRFHVPRQTDLRRRDASHFWPAPR